MDKFGLPDAAVRQICAVFADYPEISQVLVYGSRALGNWRNGSDIDLCIEAESLSFEKLLAIENRLDDLLLPWKIDLSVRYQIDNQDLLDHIDRLGQVFYRRT
jgi:predicted nucleotidyltransferase